MPNLRISKVLEKGDNLSFARIADGDKKAFDAFFDHYYPKLVRYAMVFVHCKQEAEDVVAEVLTNVLIHRERVFRLSHIESYLYSSVKNKSLSSLKRKGKTVFSSPATQPPKYIAVASDNPYELLVEQELHTLARKIIQDLPPKRQMVFRLLREEGLSYRQVAERMEISERTVEVHLKLAIGILRKNIERYLEEKKKRKVTPSIASALISLLFYFFFTN